MTTAFELAYLKIRDMITRGELGANDPLIPDDLARLCGVSRTPVREAILRLEAEMFVTRLDNKRTVVRSWSPDEIDVFVELRLRVGGLVAARAAMNIDGVSLGTLRMLNKQLADLIEQGCGPLEVLETTGRFYEILIAATQSDRLSTISYQLVNPAPLIRHIERHAEQRMTDMLHAHCELVEAMEARDPRWAEAAMVAFVRKTYRSDVLALLRQE